MCIPTFSRVGEAMNMGVSEGGLFASGTLIANRYEVVSVLGTGAMGTVVRVIDRALDNEVCALKLLHPHQARDKTSFARFRNEVILARRLGHPHISRIYDLGHAGGGYYYISMEFIPGGSLNQVIYQQRREHFVFHDCLRMLAEIADGIGYAHRMGTVHRDLKPENILIGDRGDVKITDFGLARSLTADKGFTDTGETVGTPCYMAPEQLRGERVDGRCDIYALGIIAYELVVGRRPFFDESYFALAAMHMRMPLPDFATKESGIPKWFEELVKRCAAKDPAERYQDPAEIAEELRYQIKNFATPEAVRRTPAVLSFYAPTKLQRTVPSRIKAASRWLLAGGLATASVCVGLWMNGTDVPALFRRIGHAVSQGQPAGTASAEVFGFISSGDEAQLRSVLSLNPKLAQQTINGRTPLIAAVQSQSPALAKIIIDSGGDVNVKDAQGFTPLIHAVQQSGRTLVDVLLQAGADVNARDALSNTALIHAVRAGNQPAALILMESGAQLNPRNDKGQTALFEAVARKDVPAIQLLLSRSADPNIQDVLGRTSLSYAAEADDDAIVKMLLQKGANPGLADLNNRSAVSFAGKKTKKLLGGTGGQAENDTPQVGESNFTRLRGVGDIEFALESSASGPRRIVRGNVKNFGGQVAKQITVNLQTASGKTIALSGPAQLESNESGAYSAVLPPGIEPNSRDRLIVQCQNCWR